MPAIVSMLLANTLVALLIALSAIVAGQRRRPALAHALWLLVLIKLVTPPLFHVPVLPAHAEPVPASMTASVPAQEAAAAASAPLPSADLTPRLPSTVAIPVKSSTILTSPSATIAPPRRWPIPSAEMLICTAWALGSAGLLALVLVRIGRFERLLRLARGVSPGLQADLLLVAGRFGVTRPPRVLLLPAAISPMLWYAGRAPLLLLPEKLVTALPSEQRSTILAHELAHLKRGDHYVRLLETLATILLWWHPLLWFTRRHLRAAEEQACDALVVAHFPESPRIYATALVESLRLVSTPAAACASGLGHGSTLHRRLDMILDHSPSSLRSPRLLLAAAALLLPLAPSWAQQASPPASPGMPARQMPAFAPAAGNAPASPEHASDATATAVRALLEAATDANNDVRNSALSSLARMGSKAVPTLLDALRDAQLAPVAIQILQGLNPDAIDPLLDGLKSPDASTRQVTLATLGRFFGSASPPEITLTAKAISIQPGAGPGAAPDFFTLVGNPLTVNYGGLPGFPAPPGSDALIQKVITAVKPVLNDDDARVRSRAILLWATLAQALVNGSQQQGPPDLQKISPMIDTLVSALKDKAVEPRASAAAAVGMLAGSAPQGTVAALIPVLDDPDPVVRRMAIGALAQFGPNARDATAPLTKSLKDSDPQTRIAAANALGAIIADVAPPPGGPEPFFGQPPRMPVPMPAPAMR